MRTLAAALVVLSLAADWPCWRGPDRNGISTETGWRDRWPADGPPIAWKASVGIGFSSVAVSQGRLFTMGHADGEDTIHALDAVTGKPLWKHSYKSDLGDLYFEGGPTATPTVHGNRVYTLSRWGNLFCLDAATGKVHWSADVVEQTEARVPTWGFSGSVVVHDDLLLLTVGKTGLALERDSGKVVWKSAEQEAGYATPLPFRRDGRWFVLLSAGNAFTAVDLRTGQPAWAVRWITRYGVNAADPIVAGDYVFLSSGYNKGAALFKLGDGEPAEVWRNKDLRNQCNPSVLLDGHLYGIDGDTGEDATLRCLDFKTGQVRWTEEGIGSGSVMAADGKLIVLSERGELMVAPATPEGFKPTARARVLTGKCWTVPVLANGRIYCRNAAGDLVCVDVRGGP